MRRPGSAATRLTLRAAHPHIATMAFSGGKLRIRSSRILGPVLA
jgi:hypothetical protein